MIREWKFIAGLLLLIVGISLLFAAGAEHSLPAAMAGIISLIAGVVSTVISFKQQGGNH